MRVAAWDIFWVQKYRHYAIIVTANSQILGFLISSNPARDLDPESRIASAYAGISPADTDPSFLRHNSFVSCVKFFKFKEGELTRRMGILLPNARRRIRDAAQKSRLSRKDKIKVNKAFSSR